MDWRGFAKRLLLADGRIDAAETALIRRAVLADGQVDQDEVEFLLELRRDATGVHPEFAAFVYEEIGKAVLKDGTIDKAETAWLRGLIFGRGLLAGQAEQAFLSDLGKQAKKVHPDFLALLADCGGPAR